eukprot:TRINITY_DN33273_c0_g1_i4.p1 TRINITY_DN33273_c0_g1~~TRINITY_DN33273_c0_g1_i4.p1  ORF type:complete len:128 (-),score=41.21 TRINITY_DN33273_c0_g1_i4:146-529(-)
MGSWGSGMGGMGGIGGMSAGGGSIPQGRVMGHVHAWLAEKGFGFAKVAALGTDDVFIHTAHTPGGQPLNVGDMLEFDLEQSTKKDGRKNFTAKNIKVLTEADDPTKGGGMGGMGGMMGGMGNMGGMA